MLPTTDKQYDPEMPSPTAPTLNRPLTQPSTAVPSAVPPAATGATASSSAPAPTTGAPASKGPPTDRPQTGGTVADILPQLDMGTLIDWHRLNVLVMFFAFMSFVASCLIENRGQLENYQIGVGAASFGIAFITMLVSLFNKFDSEPVKIGLSMFQFAWWIQGVIVLTFLGSFQTTLHANGYFGSWFAFFFSGLMFVSVTPFFEAKLDKEMHSPRKSIWFLIIASAVVMGAGIGPCSPQSACYKYPAWSIVLGSFSLFLSIVMFLLSGRLAASSLAFVAKFLILWWAVGTLVVTFGGPFTTTGNGYFFSYAGFIASIAVLQSCL
ncbi:hypothetical protein BASA81_003930 [Batrachochytrium salamandrivorans]|nr:hypothetical protein BASA81_003930 [Batrachochytrium salamandrivorans]